MGDVGHVEGASRKVFGLPMTPEMLALWQKYTGRTQAPGAAVTQ